MGCCGKQSEHVTFSVKGMSCGHCKMAVEKTLKGLDGVSEAEVNLDEANVTVNFDPSKLDIEKMKEVVREAGYQPE
ncbi:MAG: heavy-metal-associated domain-containing protein [Halanaerobiales bacterium]|nr:heavy-metal-associated domain-containing protein [Halanaerobiales bacterium]